MFRVKPRSSALRIQVEKKQVLPNKDYLMVVSIDAQAAQCVTNKLLLGPH